MPAQIDLTYSANLRCTARHISAGQHLVTDASQSAGGLGENFSPTDLVVVGLGTCILTTLAIVAQRHGLDLWACRPAWKRRWSARPFAASVRLA